MPSRGSIPTSGQCPRDLDGWTDGEVGIGLTRSLDLNPGFELPGCNVISPLGPLERLRFVCQLSESRLVSGVGPHAVTPQEISHARSPQVVTPSSPAPCNIWRPVRPARVAIDEFQIVRCRNNLQLSQVEFRLDSRPHMVRPIVRSLASVTSSVIVGPLINNRQHPQTSKLE